MAISSPKKFFEDAKMEFKHVNWPTRQEATRLTVAVIGLSLAIAVFLGAFDFLFTFTIKEFVLNRF